MKTLHKKIYKNALIAEQLVKLSRIEKQQIILKLIPGKSEQELAGELGIPKSTIHDWKTLRQDNTGAGIHLSLSNVYRKLCNMTPQDITDWGRLEQIRDVCEQLLRVRK